MSVNYLGTFFFAVALVHTFAVSVFARKALQYTKNSVSNSLFLLLSEVEIVFLLWAAVFFVIWCFLEGSEKVIQFQQSINMSEPLFIFCILIIASTRPIISLARSLIIYLSRIVGKCLKISSVTSQVLCLFIIGPLLGSLITEPAAITVVALLLYKMIDVKKVDQILLYGLLGLLFVNISIGGSITHFAAPPILIVARIWRWGLSDVFLHLGIAGLAAVLVNALLFTIIFRKKISTQLNLLERDFDQIPVWVTFFHLVSLGLVTLAVHYEKVFFGIFLMFIGLTTVTKKYQDPLKIKEGFLVACFLAGLVVFGSFQRWWLEPLLTMISDKTLFFSATLITAITDNAALTLLGSQVASISDSSKWALVSGALAGGGLTILANAPNPIGFSILSDHFPNHSLNAKKLFLAAILPTGVAVACFLLLGNF